MGEALVKAALRRKCLIPHPLPPDRLVYLDPLTESSMTFTIYTHATLKTPISDWFNLPCMAIVGNTYKHGKDDDLQILCNYRCPFMFLRWAFKTCAGSRKIIKTQLKVKPNWTFYIFCWVHERWREQLLHICPNMSTWKL